MSKTWKHGLAAAAAAVLGFAAPAFAADDQSALKPVLNASDKLLKFDWPAVTIGTGEYEEGPTGVTVFRFARRSLGAIDVRGGGPGTVNSDYLRLGYDTPEVDAVVFAGGSWYGLETVTAVDTALKDDGVRDGRWDNIGLSVGSIIYDLGDRRLNEIYPDKRLAQAALHAAVPGSFPLGAHGAGRMARTGGLFKCDAASGQGGAFRQVGQVKIAAFVVVNALGVVTDRSGHVAACHGDAGWPAELKTADLMADYPDSRKPGWTGKADDSGVRHNTTVSLVVVNQKLSPADLQRLAVQVHTSMARAIQPFATQFDGDVLYAVSTEELDGPGGLSSVDLGVMASEAMWDAILSSVPEQPKAPALPAQAAAPPESTLKRYVGDYVFSRFVSLRVSEEGGRLYAQAVGQRAAYAIGRDARRELTALSASDFTVPGRYPLVLSFDGRGGLVINPGPYAQAGRRR